MKIGELSLEVIKAHCGISDMSGETNILLEMYKIAAVAWISGDTGIPQNELDNYEDLTVACCCIIDDMYNNRSMTVNKNTLNPTVIQILGSHSRNLLA